VIFVVVADLLLCLLPFCKGERLTVSIGFHFYFTQHLYCRGCLKEGLNATHRPQCPSCRKEVHLEHDVVYVDPFKKDKVACAKARDHAKERVFELSRELEESAGLLSPELWNQLYLAIDEPEGADNSLDQRVSAIPRHFLAHLREAITGLSLHCNAKTAPRVLDFDLPCLSSKVKWLLRHLPRNERSVVFSSSKSAVQHLAFVLRHLGIECRSLFSGQKVEDTERAVTDWKSTELEPNGNMLVTVPVLLVQAGAAASGLTLTAASKMFLLEPFLHQSEEQQAYGRLHRYGQEHPVDVKVLYTPVSVESRLLEWRKRGAAALGENSNTKIVYALDESDDEDDFEDIPEEETDQTKFLLGITV